MSAVSVHCTVVHVANRDHKIERKNSNNWKPLFDEKKALQIQSYAEANTFRGTKASETEYTATQ